MTTAQQSSNVAKYETGNPVVQRMIGGFFEVLADVIGPLDPASVLDAGCGEGETIERLDGLLPDRIAAVDVEASCVDAVRARHPGVEVSRESVDALPFADGAFDLVLCLEVLEHVPDPERAVRELARVAARDVVVSVPYEPWFRIGSMLRGKYLTTLGNHPEHVNHWNRRTLQELLEPAGELSELRAAFPWLIASVRVRG